MEGLTVSLSPDGVPDAFTVAGDSWRVAEEPVRWYERIPWWKTETRMQRDHGRIDVEVWQLQLQTAIIPDLTPIGASWARQKPNRSAAFSAHMGTTGPS